jgi:hypothetical protein
LALFVTHAAWAGDAGLMQCRGINDAAARLACYDALPVEMPTLPGSSPPAATPQDDFGREERNRKEELQAIDSHIPGRFDGWQPRDKIRLANGQVWQIVDGSSGALNAVDPKIRVRRGALGAYYLEIDGTNRSPRVRRVQ